MRPIPGGLATLGFLGFLAVSPAQALPSSPTPAGAETAVRSFGAALARGDSSQLGLLAAPGFELVEDGQVLDLNGAIASIRQTLTGGTLTRTSIGFHTSMKGEVAWMRFRTRGRFVTPAGGAMEFDRVETAVAEMKSGAWRLVLMTSMPAPKPAPARETPRPTQKPVLVEAAVRG